MRFLLGVDEAGRGPLAGPVSVGMVMAPFGFDVAKEFPGVADSKKLSEKRREEIFTILEARAAKGDIQFCVEFESAEIIDTEGIVSAIRKALARGLGRIATKPEEVFIQLDGASAPLEGNSSPSLTGQARLTDSVHILLDGSLTAPPQYSQETIQGGDASVPLISLASIAAKVLRDRLMVQLAAEHPQYLFEKHKGYGTALHYERLREHGPCPLHRHSFLKSL